MTSGDPLPRSEPEAQGIPSGAIAEFLRAADAKAGGMHAFMHVRHGVVVAEAAWAPVRIGSPRMLFSLSKSFASTAVGLAVAEGRLSVEDPVLSFFPRKAPRTVSPNLAAMKVRHLLSMNTGHDADTTNLIMMSRDPVRAFLALPVEREPGAKFVYNTGATFVLSAIVQSLTGQRLTAYLAPRLFDKIGIAGASWERHPCGVEFGGFGLSLKLEDIARFGLLYLRKGLWEGRRVLPEAWVEEATAKVSENADPGKPDSVSDWQQGYGYQFWRCRGDAYRGDGAFGQYCVVLPGEDAVFAAVSGLSDMQLPLDLVHDILRPAMAASALPPDPAAAARLASLEAGLSLAPPSAPERGATGAASGGRTYRFEPNWAGLASLGFEFGSDRLDLQYRITRSMAKGNGLTGPLRPRSSGARKLRVGYGEWLEDLSRLEGEGPKPAASAGAWTAPDTFVIEHFARETPFITKLTCSFAGDELLVEVKRNVGFGPIEMPPLRGRAR
jgi:CubicO group peptidase (beta-lactamase class C family)